jgi:hypothetical protein
MPKIEKHKEYIDNIAEIKKCRDCYEGQKAIHEAKETYLPKLAGTTQTVKDRYEAYLSRTLFLNGFGKTVDVFTGMIFRKPVQIKSGSDEVKKKVEEEHIGENQKLTDLIIEIVNDVLISGKGGILVDHGSVEGENPTLEDAKRQGVEAKLTYFPYESIIDWGDNYYILEETITEYLNNDIFEKKEIIQRIVLDLDESGKYRQRYYEQLENPSSEVEKDKWVLQRTESPTVNGKSLDFIPFYEIKIGKKPLLIDLANINIQHYQVYADYRNGIHYTGFPQPVIIGHNPGRNSGGSSKEYVIGSDVAWNFKETSAKVQYLEYQGAGLQYPESLLGKLEDKMAQFGSRILIEEKKANETARKAEIDRSGEGSLLSLVSIVVSSQLTKAVRMQLTWNGSADSDIKIELNQDFIEGTPDPELLKELFASLIGGAISYDTFWSNIQRIEIGDINRTAEEEKELIENDSGDSLDRLNKSIKKEEVV